MSSQDFTEEYFRGGKKLRFNNFVDLEDYFEEIFDPSIGRKFSTKVIGLVIYVFDKTV